MLYLLVGAYRAQGVKLMSDLYTIDEASETLTTATCKFIGNDLHTNNNVYEVIIKDLCHCMVAAIELDDAIGKQAIGAALHTILSSVLSIE